MHVLEMQPSRGYFLDTVGTLCVRSAAIQRVFFGPLFGTCFALGAALQSVFSGHLFVYCELIIFTVQQYLLLELIAVMLLDYSKNCITAIIQKGCIFGLQQNNSNA